MTTSGLLSPTGFRAPLDKLLSQLHAPTLHDSAWIGHFEQLVGAALVIALLLQLGHPVG